MVQDSQPVPNDYGVTIDEDGLCCDDNNRCRCPQRDSTSSRISYSLLLRRALLRKYPVVQLSSSSSTSSSSTSSTSLTPLPVPSLPPSPPSLLNHLPQSSSSVAMHSSSLLPHSLLLFLFLLSLLRRHSSNISL
ncbi:hypothetical protein Pcinc_035286 [Petrolisthes cinctipes]|uniref:Uncharacterized protein n=1 Tax=Petrolisthes cinctipes TaxID=88211 RepID=A0AAE1BWT9_PETCI|nr:hypothetical protein Pcinc_035286 [Petrolisthes cinctipes]